MQGNFRTFLPKILVATPPRKQQRSIVRRNSLKIGMSGPWWNELRWQVEVTDSPQVGGRRFFAVNFRSHRKRSTNSASARSRSLRREANVGPTCSSQTRKSQYCLIATARALGRSHQFRTGLISSATVERPPKGAFRMTLITISLRLVRPACEFAHEAGGESLTARNSP